MNVIAPPSATDTVVLSLLNMFSDPEGAKKAIKAYNDARVAAETAIKQAASASSANTQEAERLAHLAAELENREKVLAQKEQSAADLHQNLTAREQDHLAAVRAHASAVKQANTEASRRDSELGRREHAVNERERIAAEKHDAAEAVRKKHQNAVDAMNAAMGRV